VLDSIERFVGKGSSGRTYIAIKDGKKYKLKILPYESNIEKPIADNEERSYFFLKGLSLYLINI
jgi:hypothetical protein